MMGKVYCILEIYEIYEINRLQKIDGDEYCSFGRKGIGEV